MLTVFITKYYPSNAALPPRQNFPSEKLRQASSIFSTFKCRLTAGDFRNLLRNARLPRLIE